MSQERFHFKGFVSLLMAFGFALLTLSGLVLYVAPRGRVANWTGWSMLGIEKENWAAVHVVLALLIVVAAVFHLAFNWSLFWTYIKSRAVAGLNKKRELAAAFGITVLVSVGTLYGVQPFRSVTSLSEYFKDSWEGPSYQAPYPHAELSSVADYAQKTGTTAESVVAKLQAKGIRVSDTTETIARIAEANGRTPQALFVETAAPKAASHEGSGSGPGRKTIQQLAAEQGMSAEVAVAMLKKAGIEAAPEENLRAIADRAGKNPHDLLALLKP